MTDKIFLNGVDEEDHVLNRAVRFKDCLVKFKRAEQLDNCALLNLFLGEVVSMCLASQFDLMEFSELCNHLKRVYVKGHKELKEKEKYYE